MRLLLVAACVLAVLACRSKSAHQPVPGELARYGELAASVRSTALAVRDDGGLLFAGETFGTLELGDVTVTGSSRDGAAFVVALDREGKQRWARPLGHCMRPRFAVRGTTTAIAASCNGPVSGYGGATLQPPAADGYDHVFLAVIDDSGHDVWSRYAGAPKGQFVDAVTFDPTGNLIAVGNFYNAIDLGTGKLTASESELSDGYVVSFDPAGKPRWVKTFPRAIVQAVAASPRELAIAGSFRAHTTVGATTLTADQGARFFARVTFDGEIGAAFVVAPGTFASNEQGLAATPTGTFVLAYDNQDGIVLASVTDTATSLRTIAYGRNAVSRDTCLIYSSRHLRVAPDGSIVLAGCFQRPVDLGGGTLQPVGFDDAFIARYAADGKLVAAKVMGTEGQDELGGLAIDGKGDVFAATHAENGPPGKPYRELLVTEVYYAATIARVAF